MSQLKLKSAMLLLVGALVVVWWLVLDHSRTPAGEVRDQGTETGHPTLAPQPDWARALAEMGAAMSAGGNRISAAPTEQATTRRRCAGRVVDELGRPVAGAVVAVVPDASQAEAAGARGASASDGAFGMDVMVDAHDARVWHVIGYRNGLTRVQQALGAPETNESWEGLTLVLVRGGTVRGTIVDPSGAPIVGLPVLVTSRQRVPTTSRRRSLFDTDALLFQQASEGYWECRVVTDAAGAFEATGLGDAPYTAWSLDDRWYLPPPSARYKAGAGSERIRAARGLTMELEVVDAQTLQPVSAFEGEMHVLTPRGGGKMIPIRGRDGRYDVCWMDVGETETGFAIAVTISAAGYESSDARVEFSPSQQVATLRVLLIPQATAAAVIFIVTSEGAPATGPFLANLVSAPDKRTRHGGVALRPVGEAGSFEIDVAEGRWFAHIHRANELARLGGWRGEIRAFHSKSIPMRLALPEEGSLEIEVAPDWSRIHDRPCPLLLSASRGGAIGSAQFTGPTAFFPGIPPGEWTLQWMPTGLAKQTNIAIRANEATRVILEP